MTIDELVRAKDSRADRNAIQNLGQATYISFRPTFEFGEHTVSEQLSEAEDFRLDYGRADGPAYTMAKCDSAEDAIETMIAIKAAYPHLRLWYDGLETQAEINPEVWVSIAKMQQEIWEEWEVVERVASGNLLPDDPEVLDAISRVPLIAAAIAHITSSNKIPVLQPVSLKP